MSNKDFSLIEVFQTLALCRVTEIENSKLSLLFLSFILMSVNICQNHFYTV